MISLIRSSVCCSLGLASKLSTVVTFFLSVSPPFSPSSCSKSLPVLQDDLRVIHDVAVRQALRQKSPLPRNAALLWPSLENKEEMTAGPLSRKPSPHMSFQQLTWNQSWSGGNCGNCVNRDRKLWHKNGTVPGTQTRVKVFLHFWHLVCSTGG